MVDGLIRVTCTCGKRLKTVRENAGRRTKCPRCGAPLTFPAGDRSASSSIPAEDKASGPPADPKGDSLAWMLRTEADMPFPFRGVEAVAVDRLLADSPDPSASPIPPPTPPAPSAREDVRIAAAVQRSPVRRDPEPVVYLWASFLAVGLAVVGAGQFVITLLVALAQSGSSGAAQSTGDGPPPNAAGSAFAMLAYSFGLAVSCGLAASVVGVIVDAARNVRELRADLVGRGVEAEERTEGRTRPPAGSRS